MLRRGTSAGERGTTLIEVMLVLVVVGVLACMAWPKFSATGEQARVDQAAAELRSLWVGERLHWIETGRFSPDLAALRAEHLLDAAVGASTTPFACSVVTADDTTFNAHAVRSGSTVWSGELALDEGGQITGFTSDPGGLHVAPSNP